MKKTILFVFAIMLLNNVVAQSPQGNPERFTEQTTFSDEFNGTSLNSTKWHDTPIDYFQTDVGNCYYSGAADSAHAIPTYFTWYVTSTDNYMIDSSGTSTKNINFGTISEGSGNSAKLIVRKESTALDVRKEYYGANYSVTQSTDKTGKIIGSKQIFYHGYFEIRAKLPSSRSWSGQQFWMYRAYPGTPPLSWITSDYSEIDIFEINDYDFTRSPAAIHYWPTTANDQYVYNADKATNEDIFVSDLSGSSGFHTYGVNWQTNSVDFYIDGALVAHNTDLEFASWLVGDTNYTGWDASKSVNVLMPMRVYLSTKFTESCDSTTAYPTAGQDVNFEVDYFRYYKMNPLITNYSLTGTTSLNLTAAQGIDNENYVWSVVSGPATKTSDSQNSNSSTASFALNSGSSVVKVTSTTGASYISATYNPSMVTETKIWISGLNCWNVCQADILSTVNEYYAKCIVAPGGGACTTLVINGGRNIKFVADDEIYLDAGFEVNAGSSFEAQVP